MVNIYQYETNRRQLLYLVKCNRNRVWLISSVLVLVRARLEALAMDDGGSGLVVFLLGDPPVGLFRTKFENH